VTTERIQILVTERGTRQVVRSIGSIGTTSDRAAGSVGTLQRAVATLGSALAIRQILRLSDAYIQVENRLRLVTGSTEDLVAVQNELFAVANRTRSSFEATAELYARVALSARNLGVTQREVLDFTEALNQAIILSGATAQEARNGVIQFAQGLASNRLAGDELRATLEQLPLVADIIARQFGVTRGALRELAAQGKITGQEILAAFGPEVQAELEASFANTIPTIEQSLTVLQNRLIRFLGELNRGTGVFSLLARATAFLADNFEFFGRFVLGAAVLPAIIGVTSALASLTIALFANPFTAIVSVLSIAIGLLVAFEDQILLNTDSLATLGDVAVSLGQEFLIAFQQVGGLIAELTGGVFQFGNTSQITLESVLRFAARTADGFVGTFVGAFFALGRVFQNLPKLIGSTTLAILNAIIGTIEGFLNVFVRVVNEIVLGSIISLNELIALANKASEALGQGPIASVISAKGFRIENLDVGRIENDLGGVAEGFSEAVLGGFREGFESVNGVQDLLDRALARAETRASTRQAEQAAAPQGNLDNFPSGETGDRDTLADIALRDRLQLLARENELVRESLGLTAEQRAVKEQLFEIEEQLRRKGVELTESQRAQIAASLEQNIALQTQVDILDRLQGPAQSARFEIDALTTLFDEGKISVAEFNAELRRLRTDELSGNQDVFSGFERGLISVQETISDFGAQAEQTLTNAFSGAEDALVSFVTTGQADFSGLVDSILADLTRLLARQALFALLGLGGGGGLSGAGGLGSFLFGGAFGGARAEGGPVRPDQAFLVGEQGPELFQPPTSGTIVPNGAMGGAPPQVNVQVVNVTDPNQVASAMAEPGVQERIVNVIRSNRTAVRTALGI
jgi:tape measure domain-containing protein